MTTTALSPILVEIVASGTTPTQTHAVCMILLHSKPRKPAAFVWVMAGWAEIGNSAAKMTIPLLTLSETTAIGTKVTRRNAVLTTPTLSPPPSNAASALVDTGTEHDIKTFK